MSVRRGFRQKRVRGGRINQGERTRGADFEWKEQNRVRTYKGLEGIAQGLRTSCLSRKGVQKSRYRFLASNRTEREGSVESKRNTPITSNKEMKKYESWGGGGRMGSTGRKGGKGVYSKGMRGGQGGGRRKSQLEGYDVEPLKIPASRRNRGGRAELDGMVQRETPR